MATLWLILYFDNSLAKMQLIKWETVSLMRAREISNLVNMFLFKNLLTVIASFFADGNPFG